jgi:hypothetical protein
MHARHRTPLIKRFLAVVFSPEFCEKWCPICVRARKGVRWARWVQRLELALTAGGCPWGRARQKKYGVPPNLPIGKGVE